MLIDTIAKSVSTGEYSRIVLGPVFYDTARDELECRSILHTTLNVCKIDGIPIERSTAFEGVCFVKKVNDIRYSKAT